MPANRYRWASVCVLSLLFPVGSGCQIGPSALKVSMSQYSDAIQVTSAEQMLLNLVRLRYREKPVFLAVSSISTQFEFNEWGQIAGTLNENVGQGAAMNPGSLGLTGRIAYSERPTITYTILGGQDFVQRMLKPMSVERISLVAESGWSSSRILRMTVEGVNGLPNAPTASGPTPSVVPEFREFREATQLIRKLETEQIINMEYETRVKQVSVPLRPEAVDAGAIINAAKAGAQFRKTADGQQLVLTKESRVLVLRFGAGAEQSAGAARLRELLKLSEREREFDLVELMDSDYDPLAPERLWTDIALDTRSLMGVLYYLSQAVHVPSEHEAAGFVTTTVYENGRPFDWAEMLGDLLTVYVGTSPPHQAAVRVRHRGYWFYIREDDETSKSTFALLGLLFDLQAGDIESTKPVLTLPVGG